MDEVEELLRLHELYTEQGFANEISFFEFLYMYRESGASTLLDKSDDGQTIALDTTPPVV